MKMTITRTFAFILAVMMCLSMAASTAGATGASGSTDYRVVNISYSSDPGNFLPFNADNSVRDTISLYLYEHLFDTFYNGVLTPTIATGYERLGNGVYRITINQNAHDSKGNPITADDVVFCYQTSVDIGERKATLGDLKEVKKIDDYTIELTISPDGVGIFEKMVCAVPIVSQKSYEESETGFSSDPVGTGPYVVKEWLPGSYITFAKDENYWDKGGPMEKQNCDEITIKYIAEPAQVAIEMETGGIDFAYNISSKDADLFADMPGFAVVNTPFVQVRSVGFNCDESNVFSDIRLRHAVSYAIDAAGIVQGVYDGKGGVPSVPAVPEGGYFVDYVEAWNDDIPYEYNVEKAKELMAEAGYPDGGLKVRLMTKDMPEYRSTGEVIQANLAEIGIEVEILSYENALYQTYRYQPDAYDFYLCQVAPNDIVYVVGGWKWYMDADKETGKNPSFMQDAKMQELLWATLNVDTYSEETLDALWQYMKETCPIYPYAYTYNNYVHVDTIADPLIRAGIMFYPNMSTFAEN